MNLTSAEYLVREQKENEMSDINRFEPWVTAEKVREYLGEADNQTVLRLVRERKIPGVKIAGQWKFKISMIDEMLMNKATQQKGE